MCLLCTHALLNELRLPSEVNILIEGGHKNSNQAAQILGELQRVPVEILPLPVKILTAGLGCKDDHPILHTRCDSEAPHFQGFIFGNWYRHSCP